MRTAARAKGWEFPNHLNAEFPLKRNCWRHYKPKRHVPFPIYSQQRNWNSTHFTPFQVSLPGLDSQADSPPTVGKSWESIEKKWNCPHSQESCWYSARFLLALSMFTLSPTRIKHPLYAKLRAGCWSFRSGEHKLPPRAQYLMPSCRYPFWTRGEVLSGLRAWSWFLGYE